MRLVTRSDFDGLACGALLLEAGIIDSWKFAHPKDLQDGLVEIGPNDCLANVPYVEGCGLWFDHHSSEHERLELEGKYLGESRVAPSCARIIYEYYGGKSRFPQFDELMEAVDKVDSGNLTIDEVMNPQGWILVGFLMDPRTSSLSIPSSSSPYSGFQLSPYDIAMPNFLFSNDRYLNTSLSPMPPSFFSWPICRAASLPPFLKHNNLSCLCIISHLDYVSHLPSTPFP